MLKFFKMLMIGSLLISPITGCGGGPAEETLKTASADDPMLEPLSLLERYADGQRMTSEAQSFPYLAKRVKESDPVKGEILEKGFEELKNASDSARKRKAKELIEKLKGTAAPAK